jgi:hypothetical protein
MILPARPIAVRGVALCSIDFCISISLIPSFVRFLPVCPLDCAGSGPPTRLQHGKDIGLTGVMAVSGADFR